MPGGVVLVLEYSLYPFKEHIGNFDSVSSSRKCYVLIKGVPVISMDGSK